MAKISALIVEACIDDFLAANPTKIIVKSWFMEFKSTLITSQISVKVSLA